MNWYQTPVGNLFFFHCLLVKKGRKKELFAFLESVWPLWEWLDFWKYLSPVCWMFKFESVDFKIIKIQRTLLQKHQRIQHHLRNNLMESFISLTLESLNSKQVFQVPPPHDGPPRLGCLLTKAVWSLVPWSEDFVEIRGGDAPTSAKPTKWEVRLNQRTNCVSQGWETIGDLKGQSLGFVWTFFFFFKFGYGKMTFFIPFPFLSMGNL